MIAKRTLTAADITGDIVNRFWAKVSKADHPKGCWEWTGAGVGNGPGYGVIKIAGKTYNTHRVSWLMHFGDIPAGLMVCHRCDNRVCVRPDHFFLGTGKDNAQDAASKGRMFRAQGELGANAKLTDQQVLEIRQLAADGMSSREIGERFGMFRTSISDVVSGRSWAHLGGPRTVRQPKPQEANDLDRLVDRVYQSSR